MERFSQRESILLGYSPQNSFINSTSSPSTSQKSSDVDFHDVFGGPPKRSSLIHDQMRYSFNDVRATNRLYKGDDDDEDDDKEEGWSEKPVFGDESLNRSMTHSDDFFDDIFKGSSSVSSSPRRVQRDPYSSSPGSRVLSPARSLPLKSDSALLPVFSLPAKLTKAVDTPTSIGSITRTTSLSRFSSQSLQGVESLRSDNIRSSRRMILSQDFAVRGEGTSNNGNEDDAQSNSKEDSKSSVSPTSGKFHFSIYKWASSKPMVMPLRGRSGSRVHTTKNEAQSSANESADDENMAKESPISTLPNVSDQLLADSSSSTLESEKKESDVLTAEEVQVERCQIIKDTTILPVVGSSETFSSLHSTVENDVACDWPKKGDNILCRWPNQNNISCQTTSADLHQKGSYEDQAHKPDLKPIHSLFFDDDFGQGISEKAKLASTNSSVDVGSSKNTKNQNGKRISSTNTQAVKAAAQSSPRRENLGRNKVKGKVKDFVKMFSHEVSSSKAEDDGDVGSQHFKKKEKIPIEPVNEEATNKTPTLHEELQSSNVKKIYTEASIKTTEDVKQFEKEACEAKTASSSGSVSNSSKANIGDTDVSFHENFQIEELTQEDKTPPQVIVDLEEIQAIDAKIRQWSKGKEGNIRSLLTTVQHILWPGSGWKTVPLVDIIEGNAVKRSYQRAMLCLHPDKLQQKGATPQQKYTAEKVFDILQEAWDHFNSLGPL